MVTIRRRAGSVVQSGRARRGWVLSFEPAAAPALDPLTGWTATADPLAGHKIAFHTAEAAMAFAERKGWRYRLVEADRPEAGPGEGAGGVDEQSEQSFPASDSPSWTLGGPRGR